MQASYQDIFHCTRPAPFRRPMPALNRAAQFAPYAALVGLDGIISRTAQSAEEEVAFAQYADELLEWQLQITQLQEEGSWD